MNGVVNPPDNTGPNSITHNPLGIETSRQEQNDLARRLAAHCASYKFPDIKRSVLQLSVTLALFLAIVTLMFVTAPFAYWITVVLSVPAGGLLVKLFIIQHDCGHGSFFHRRSTNQIVGRMLSLLTLTPYGFWRRAHALHHATSGNLDRRGIGDIDTLTVAEYLELPFLSRLRYRLYRNPLFLFVIGMPMYFLVLHRVPFGMPLPFSQVWRSVLALDLAIAVFYGVIIALLGWMISLSVLLPIVCIGSWVGGWLFYIQHQFEDTHWDTNGNWEILTAALKGSSYYDLHPILHWFTGSIGLHQIHHLNSRIPNYRLRECLNASPELRRISKRITFFQSLKYINLALWDEEQKKLVSFGHLNRLKHA